MTAISPQEFLKYVQAFNAHDFEVQHSFYHPDVELFLPAEETEPILKGSKGISNHYARIFGTFTEVLVPIEIIANERHLFFLMETQFQANRDIAVGIAKRPWEKGDLGRVTVWAYYDFEDGKMKRIICNQEKFEWFGKTRSLEEAVKDSQSRAAPEFVL